MRYLRQHITTIIETYDGSLPLAHFLKNYYKQNPILGSRDRKILTAMAYRWYRCGKGILNNAMAKWLNDHASDKAQSLTDPGGLFNVLIDIWLSDTGKLLNGTISEWINEHSVPFDINNLFHGDIQLSSGITKQEWLNSMLVQPDLFIRARKDKGKIISLLNGQKIPFTFITDNCLALPNGAKIDVLLPEDTYAVQDASSQQTGAFFHPNKNELWYDCCAGAGGKSLLLKDMEPGVRLTVSDARKSIIHNLQQRFRQYRHELPTTHVTDVADEQKLNKALGTKLFDNIICDAPCSGSGTWSRTPEQLYFFDPTTIEKFTALQKAIAINVSRHLKPGGRLIYITCSVFKNENEDVVAEIINETGLQLQQSQIINSVNIHADSMFVAILSNLSS